MKVVITGTSHGMGEAAAFKFLKEGHSVFGIDKDPPSAKILSCFKYFYPISVDLSKPDFSLPSIENVDILINNAGVQGKDEIQVNLKALIRCTEKYGLQPHIKSILNQASVSAHVGTEFPEYVASKGGVLAYTKWVAKEIAKYGATCNSLSFGGVITDLNNQVMKDEAKWNLIMNMTPLRKWCTCEEAAEWIYFFTVVNKSCSGQDLIIDNLETLNQTFVW